ncbi:MAG: amidohydrolase family protein [Ruminococcus sp.]|nr:amidohydrolase family protein [Ruminococcus sp.]
MMNNFVLKGDVAYSVSKNKTAYAENAYIICIEGKSAGVYRDLPEQYASLPMKDYTGKLIIPGLVDLHIHAPQFAYRGLGMDMELLDWLNAYAFPEETKYADLTYAEKAYDIFANAMKKSATTRACAFSTIHKDATVLLMRKLENTGIVSYVGKVNMDRESPESYIESSAQASAEETERWIHETAGYFNRTYPIITPRFVPSCTPELLSSLGELSRRYALPVQSHLSENRGEIEWVKELEPDSAFYGEVYDKYGLFGDPQKTVMAHCVYSTDDEMELMKERGVFVAHCPASNMNVASGIAPVRKYLDNDLNIGLGSDVAGGHTESLFTTMVETIQNSKLYWRTIDSSMKPLKFEEVFFLATKGGGAFFGKVGSFEKGYEFDALVFDDKTIAHPQPLSLSQRLERLVYLGGDRRCMQAKYVKGLKIL